MSFNPERHTPSITRIARFWSNRCLKHDTPVIYATVGHHAKWTHHIDFGEDGVRSEYSARGRILEGGCPCSREDQILYETFCDTGEPECLSCGQFLGHIPEVARRDNVAPFRGIRAHIVPWSISQDDSPSNVIPLCEWCHYDDPEQESRRRYLDWLMAQRRRKAALMKSFTELASSSEKLHVWAENDRYGQRVGEIMWPGGEAFRQAEVELGFHKPRRWFVLPYEPQVLIEIMERATELAVI
jgi:hypothetical protein